MTAETIAAAAALGAASSLHCIAMCGPLVMAGCARERGGRRSTLAYLAGRLVSYAGVGALAGGIGGPLVVAAGASREIRILVGLLLAISVGFAAIRWIRGAQGSTLVRLGRKPSKIAASFSSLARFIPSRGLGLGLATGLFPCGALASGLVVAAASGSAQGGAVVMSAFALASAPALAVVALVGENAAAWARVRIGRARPVVGVALLGVAGWLAVSPWLGARHASGSAACSCEASHAAEAH